MLQKQRRYSFILIAIWVVLIIGFIIGGEEFDAFVNAIGECIVFTLLGIQLLVVNFLLLKQINKLIGSKEEADKKFAKEKNFLISTLIFFAISYLLFVIRNLIIFTIVTTDQQEFDNVFCSSNLKESIENAVFYTIAILLPYMVIFILNCKNFKQMELQDQYIKDKYEEELSKTKDDLCDLISDKSSVVLLQNAIHSSYDDSPSSEIN